MCLQGLTLGVKGLGIKGFWCQSMERSFALGRAGFAQGARFFGWGGPAFEISSDLVKVTLVLGPLYCHVGLGCRWLYGARRAHDWVDLGSKELCLLKKVPPPPLQPASPHLSEPRPAPVQGTRGKKLAVCRTCLEDAACQSCNPEIRVL